MSKPAVRILQVEANAHPPTAATTTPQPRSRHGRPPGSGAADEASHPTAGQQNDAGENERLAPAAVSLLKLQANMREARTRLELAYFVANEARIVLRAQQIVVFGIKRGRTLGVETVTSLSSLDRSSPLVLWFESLPAALKRNGHLAKSTEFDAAALSGDFGSVAQSYPLRHLIWHPWLDAEGAVAGGMLLCRSAPWVEADIRIASHLSQAFAHAWCALAGPRGSSLLARLATRRSAAIAAMVTAGLLALPVPMTALAPVEIGPRETFVVTPGIEGVVRSVDVEPNAPVKSGQRLVTLVDTTLRNRAAIAEREVLVAESKYKKAAQLAFVDVSGRHEMAIARSELDLKLAERNYTLDLLARTEIRAERDGVAFFADKRDLVGKPVSVGEKLMEVADPNTSEFRIDLPVGDAIGLAEGARVKVFLDSDPLSPVEARLVRAAYKATPKEAQQFAFRLVAKAADGVPRDALRLGMRGTAQVYSDPVPLWFYLFRRPIAAGRQWSGL